VEKCLSELAGVVHPDHWLYTRVAKLALDNVDDGHSHADLKATCQIGVLCLNACRKYKVGQHLLSPTNITTSMTVVHFWVGILAGILQRKLFRP
jgi:hypothetical protein